MGRRDLIQRVKPPLGGAVGISIVLILSAIPGCVSPPATLVPTASVTQSPTHAQTPLPTLTSPQRPTPLPPTPRLSFQQTWEAQQSTQASARETDSYHATQSGQSQSAIVETVANEVSASLAVVDLNTAVLFQEPVGELSSAQVLEAQECTLLEQLESDPQTACQWATLAYAFSHYADGDPDMVELGRQVYAKALQLNSAFSLRGPLFYEYFGKMRFSSLPPVSFSSIVTARITYFSNQYDSSTASVDYVVTHADTEGRVFEIHTTGLEVDPINRLSGHPEWKEVVSISRTVNSEFVQNLRTGWTDLVAIQSMDSRNFSLPHCEMDYSNWRLAMSMSDGTMVTIQNIGSFVIGGGPWVITIGGQSYVQTTPSFTEALSPLMEELGLLDEPLSTRTVYDDGCNALGEDLLSATYQIGQ